MTSVRYICYNKNHDILSFDSDVRDEVLILKMVEFIKEKEKYYDDITDEFKNGFSYDFIYDVCWYVVQNCDDISIDDDIVIIINSDKTFNMEKYKPKNKIEHFMFDKKFYDYLNKILIIDN